MKDIYTIELDAETFEKVVSGKKNVQLVINSNKYKVLAVGNQLTFIKKDEENPSQVKAVIENLLYFGTEKEAVETLGKEPCGYKSSATYDKASDTFLIGESYESIEKFGIVAIVFKIVE